MLLAVGLYAEPAVSQQTEPAFKDAMPLILEGGAFALADLALIKGDKLPNARRLRWPDSESWGAYQYPFVLSLGRGGRFNTLKRAASRTAPDSLTTDGAGAGIPIYLFRTRTKKAAEFGPRSALLSVFQGAAEPDGSFDWGKLTAFSEGNNLTARLFYSPGIFDHPFLAVCDSPCTQDQLDALHAAIERNEKPAGGGTDVSDDADPEPDRLRFLSVRLFGTERTPQGGLPGMKLNIAADCRERNLVGKPVNAKERVDLPFPKSSSEHVCLVFSGESGADETCLPVPVATGLAMPVDLYPDLKRYFGCAARERLVSVRYRIYRAYDNTTNLQIKEPDRGNYPPPPSMSRVT